MLHFLLMSFEEKLLEKNFFMADATLNYFFFNIQEIVSSVTVHESASALAAKYISQQVLGDED